MQARMITFASFLTALVAVSCVPTPVATITPSELVKNLSSVVLEPKIGCHDLALRFGLGDLPIVDDPSGIGLTFEEAFLQTPEGNDIDAWYVPARLNRGTVVLSYGSSGRMACYLFVTQTLVDLGWSVVMYDYRGFGGSSGTASLDSLSSDLDIVLSWTLARTQRKEVTLLGVSLGTIPSVAIAVRRPEHVNGVILDSPVAMAAELPRFNTLLGGRAAQYANALSDDLVLDRLMPKLATPMLVILDGADNVTPPDTIQLLYDLAPGPKELAYFPGFGHAFAPYYDTAMFSYRVDLFLANIWNGSAVSNSN